MYVNLENCLHVARLAEIIINDESKEIKGWKSKNRRSPSFADRSPSFAVVRRCSMYLINTEQIR